jgi:tetratricopeptide (TPR) repeat protein
MTSRWLIALAIVLIAAGCSAVGVVESSDPRVKIAQAEEMQTLGRFTVAQRLLFEALDIYGKRGDETGIAESYRRLGYFYQAPIPRQSLVPDEFGETTNGVQTRYLKAIDYYEKSLVLVQKLGLAERQANLYWLMAETYLGRLGDKAAGCASLEKARAAHQADVQARPSLWTPVADRDFIAVIDKTKRFYCS